MKTQWPAPGQETSALIYNIPKPVPENMRARTKATDKKIVWNYLNSMNQNNNYFQAYELHQVLIDMVWQLNEMS